MNEDNVIQLDDPEKSKSLFTDTLTEIARTGAQQMLAMALQAEVDAYLEQNQSNLANGHQRLVKNGHLPERSVQTGIILPILAVFFDVTPIVDIDITWVTWQKAPVVHDGEIGTFICDHPVGGHNMRCKLTPY